ncbi:MAG: protein kinase [Acidobacteria bacterium]|nr:protein kinase [Acidobacteriota bacterium]
MSVSEPVPPSGSGDSIGGYRILKTLGRGGMGEVFLAWDERLQRELAVKRIRHDSALTATLRQRLLREAQAAAKLSHPAIVHIYDLKEDPAGDCIVMEYVPGQTLAEALTVRPFEPAHAARLAREIASGLAAAHAAGIVHRDLKTENVILTPSGNAKILDFGLAKPFVSAAGDPSLTERGGVVGTCRSMSPEQARGGEVDGRSDLFSLGVLLYEVLTGEYPFRGATSLESIVQVLKHHPPRVDVIRPGVPPRLGLLVERLLAKDAADRPQSADEVVRELEAIEGALSSPTSEETLSDLPTGYFPTPPPPSQPLPRSSQAPQSTAGMSTASGSQRLRMVALVGLGALILGIAIYSVRHYYVRPVPAPPPPRRVLVLRPEVKDKRLYLAASRVLGTVLKTLRALEGMEVIDPSEVVGTPASLKAKAKAAAADEVLVPTVDDAGDRCVIMLNRVEGSTSKSLWNGDPFEAPLEQEDHNLLEEGVAQSLKAGYSGYRSRPSLPRLQTSDWDYATFIEIQGKLRTDSIQNLLPKLEDVIARSPRFLEAQLLAADMYLTQFDSTRDTLYLDRAGELISKAQSQAPGETQPLFMQFKLEMARGQIPQAKATLENLERLKTGDPQLLLLHSQLAEREGRKDEALTELRELVQRLPTWNNLYSLADLEARTGNIADARSQLEQILSDSPNNLWALEQRANIELLYGSPVLAEVYYQQLIKMSRQRPYYTNLGNARVLLKHYGEAIEAFQHALDLDAGNVAVNISLADAELARGDEQNALEHYNNACLLFESNLSGASLTPYDHATRAQCLAHLEKVAEAKADIQLALQKSPDDGNVLQAAALVYAVVGEKTMALNSIKKALAQGVQPRWFQLPAFAKLKDDPEYQGLMKKTPGATPSK